MKTIATCYGILIGVFVVATLHPAAAQTFVNYRCGGTSVAAAFIAGERSARIQVDGKSMTLPLRLSGSGSRYAKGGFQLWLKGKSAMFKRSGQRWLDCEAQ